MKDSYGFDRMRIDGVEIVPVIRVNAVVGAGVETDPCRHISRYHSLDGELICVKDKWLEEQEADRDRD